MKPKAEDKLRATLRAMPIDKRAKVIVQIFRVIAGEFAAMVLEHVKPAAVSRETLRGRPAEPARRRRGTRPPGATRH